MFYGYIGNTRSLNDVVTSLLQGRTGTLELFVNRYFLSLKVKDGFVTEFKCDVNSFDERKSNSYNLLVYCLAEMLLNPEGFFAFYEEESRMKAYSLETPVGSDELMIQATIVRRELDEIVDKIISPFAIFRATVKGPKVSFYEGKNLVEAVALSEEPVVSVVREIKDLLTEGKLDIYEFRESEQPEAFEMDYMMENVPLKRVNMIAILKSLKGSSFSGIARVSSTTYTINLFYEKGEMFAVYPVDYDIFEFFLSPDRNAELSLVALDSSIVRFVAMRFLAKPEIDTVSSRFMEVSKLALGLSKYRENALLLISEKLGDRYIVFKDGRLVMNLIESEGKFRPSDTLKFTEPYFVSLYFYKKVENLASVVYTFMINEAVSVFMRRSPTKVNTLILREALRYPFLVFSEGKFRLVKNPNEEEEKRLMDFLGFVLDLGVQEIGQKKQEEELEFQLKPFKDIFRVLNVEKFLSVPKRGNDV